MPYLLLIVGLVVGVYALYSFFLSASAKQKTAFVQVTFYLAMIIALFFLALTGRLAAAMATGGVLVPMFFHELRKHRRNKKMSAAQGDADSMTREEALDILGLQDGASKEDIKKAYHDLIKKVHPDQGGSEGLTRRLNKAKDTLLGDK